MFMLSWFLETRANGALTLLNSSENILEWRDRVTLRLELFFWPCVEFLPSPWTGFLHRYFSLHETVALSQTWPCVHGWHFKILTEMYENPPLRIFTWVLPCPQTESYFHGGIFPTRPLSFSHEAIHVYKFCSPPGGIWSVCCSMG